MKKKPSWLKSTQEITSKFLSEAKNKVSESLKDIDETLHVSSVASETSAKTKQFASEVNTKLKVTETFNKCSEAVSSSLQDYKKTDDYKALSKNTKLAKAFIKEDLLDPANAYFESKGVKSAARDFSRSAIEGYGKIRKYVKPYYAPETPEELLINTKLELIYINACILQVSRDEAEDLANKFGAAIASKIAGVATVGSLLGLVSMFGTAGTGTAIATLSGAAATNATLAWVGGLLGGGMATGALLTGGVALVVGVGVYKMLGSEARQYSDLSEQEIRIVESTGFLIAAINDILADPNKTLSVDDAKQLLENTLKPMHQLLLSQSEDIVQYLDNKNAIAFRQYALIDFEKQVIDGFDYFITAEQQHQKKHHVEFAIAGVIYALLTRTAVDDSEASQLALEAIRRVRGDWAECSESEISDVLASYSKEQLQGLANNAKGIYHEMLFVKEYNDTHLDSYAEMHSATNHAGSDVVIRSKETGEVLQECQLKASSSDAIVRDHFEKYPDIEVMATSEIAANIEGYESSGISNIVITEKMNDTLSDITDNTILDRTLESSGIAIAAQSAMQLLNGQRNIGEMGGSILKTAGITGTSTALVAYLFG